MLAGVINLLPELLITGMFVPSSDSPADQHGRAGSSQATDAQNDNGHCDCLYHLLVSVQPDVSVVSDIEEQLQLI